MGLATAILNAQTFFWKLDAVCVVNEPVEYDVRIGRIADHLMPLFDGELACDDRGAMAATLFDNLQQIITRLGAERKYASILTGCMAFND